MQEEFDTYDPSVHLFVQLQFLARRSRIIEIVSAKDAIFALAQSGLCAAFCRSKHYVPTNTINTCRSKHSAASLLHFAFCRKIYRIFPQNIAESVVL